MPGQNHPCIELNMSRLKRTHDISARNDVHKNLDIIMSSLIQNIDMFVGDSRELIENKIRIIRNKRLHSVRKNYGEILDVMAFLKTEIDRINYPYFNMDMFIQLLGRLSELLTIKKKKCKRTHNARNWIEPAHLIDIVMDKYRDFQNAFFSSVEKNLEFVPFKIMDEWEELTYNIESRLIDSKGEDFDMSLSQILDIIETERFVVDHDLNADLKFYEKIMNNISRID